MYIPFYVLINVYEFCDIKTLVVGLTINKSFKSYIKTHTYLWDKFNYINLLCNTGIKNQKINRNIKCSRNIDNILYYLLNTRDLLCCECNNEVGYITPYNNILCNKCATLPRYRLLKHAYIKKRYLLRDLDLIRLPQYYGKLYNIGHKTDLYKESDVIKLAIRVHKGIFNLEKLLQ
jgi:hypothetical protein